MVTICIIHDKMNRFLAIFASFAWKTAYTAQMQRKIRALHVLQEPFNIRCMVPFVHCIQYPVTCGTPHINALAQRPHRKRVRHRSLSFYESQNQDARIGLIRKREGHWIFSTTFFTTLYNLNEKIRIYQAPAQNTDARGSPKKTH